MNGPLDRSHSTGWMVASGELNGSPWIGRGWGGRHFRINIHNLSNYTQALKQPDRGFSCLLAWGTG